MKAPWWFCCGWRSYWCVLDTALHALFHRPQDPLPPWARRVCTRHDAAITGARPAKMPNDSVRVQLRTGTTHTMEGRGALASTKVGQLPVQCSIERDEDGQILAITFFGLAYPVDETLHVGRLRAAHAEGRR